MVMVLVVDLLLGFPLVELWGFLLLPVVVVGFLVHPQPSHHNPLIHLSPLLVLEMECLLHLLVLGFPFFSLPFPILLPLFSFLSLFLLLPLFSFLALILHSVEALLHTLKKIPHLGPLHLGSCLMEMFVLWFVLVKLVLLCNWTELLRP